MTDVVDRVEDAVPEGFDKTRRSDARRVLIILCVFMLVVLLANFWL